MYREYSARTVPAWRRARYWQDMASSVIFPLDTAFQDADKFNGTLRSWSLGEASLIQLQTDAARYLRRPHHVRSDAGDNILVSFSAHSDVGFSQDGIDLRCRRRQFFVERTNRTSDFVQTDANEIWVLKLPIASMKRHTRSIDPLFSSLYDANSGIGGLLFDMMQQVPHHYASISNFAAEGIGQTLMELLVLAVEADERALTSGRSSVQRGHIGRIEKFIRQNLGDPQLSPERIAGACNISVRYLHALFQGSGSSVAQRIRELRLESCRAQICEPHRRESLGEISYRWGFGDQAQFSRHFKTRFGMTPREMRTEAQRKAAKSNQ